MAQLVISAAGAAVGFMVGGPAGAQVGWALGSMIGGQVAASQQRIKGPRLDDLKVTGTEYGQPIPWARGAPRIAGQVWWSSDKQEVATTTRQGKGGGAKVTTYTYTVDMLIGLCEAANYVGVSRVWRNGELVLNLLDAASADTIAASVDDAPWARLTFYDGSNTQLPDAVYEAAVTTADAPGYRGRCCVFIEGLDLGSSGAIPNLTFELACTAYPPDETVLLQTGFDLDTIDDQSCDPVTTTTDGVDADDLSGGRLEFQIQRNSTGIGRMGLYWTDNAKFFADTATGWTFEVVVGGSLPAGANASQGAYVAYISTGTGYASANAAVIFAIYPGLGNYSVSKPFDTTYSGSYGGGDVHFAITYSDGDGAKVYVNGVYKGGWGALLTPGSQATIYLGGGVIISPGETAGWVNVSYKYARHRAGIHYTTAGFTPPASLDAPICADTYDLCTATLRDVVDDLCERAGMPGGSTDTAALAALTKPVRSLTVAQVTSARTVLEQLQAGWFFDCTLDSQLRFIPRGGASVATIPFDDLAAGPDTAAEQPLALTLAADLELPPIVAVQYPNIAADHNTGTEMSDVMLTGQASMQMLPLPIGMLPDEAKGIADAIASDNIASLVSTQISLPMQYARLQATDIVTVQDADGSTYRLRLVRRQDDGAVLRFDAVVDDAEAIESAGITDEDYTPQTVVTATPDTDLVLLDIPLLRDADDAPGHYAAVRAASSTGTWPGAQILQSSDDVTYAPVAEVAGQAVIGTASTALGDWTGGYVMDELNSVTVDVGAGELASTTRDALLADAAVNAVAIGSEIVRFVAAELLSSAPNVYKLTRLLRGQAGTEWAVGTHSIGDAVVLLTTTGIRRITTDAALIGQPRYLLGLTLGKAIGDTPGELWTDNGVSMMPLSVVNIHAGTVGADLEVTWQRRTRYRTRVIGAAGLYAPLAESAEAYEVEIWNGATLVTSDTVSAQAWSYTPGGSLSGYTLRIYQVSAIVGRGYASEITL